MSFVRDDVNEHGTPTSVHRCDTCGDVFTVTPRVPENARDQWDGCMSETCASYEPSRDADLYLGSHMVVSEQSAASAAWERLNRALDANGGEDSPEYREAWAEWERAITADRSE